MIRRSCLRRRIRILRSPSDPGVFERLEGDCEVPELERSEAPPWAIPDMAPVESIGRIHDG